MNFRQYGIVGGVMLVVAMLVAAYFVGRNASTTVSAAPPPAWQLQDGTAYQVADFRACTKDGMTFTEWHFGGRDRSVVNHLTPLVDFWGQRWFHRVTNEASLPPGHMRVMPVKDPYADGRRFGNKEAYVVQYNGPVDPQVDVKPCGPSR